MKLFVTPNPDKMPIGGVQTAIAAHRDGLRPKGVQYLDNEKGADLIIVHALGHANRRPDVFHSHGFYPTAQPGWNRNHDMANELLIQNTLTARSVVAVSDLAAEVMRRDFHVTPHVIPNGVDLKKIRVGGKRNGWILWPKMDVNPTCDPYPVQWLGQMRPDLKLASLTNIPGVHRFGKLPGREFRKLLSECSLYLGTTRENNSIATMEAMAMGIPVVGYRWGFNREWLINGIGCELVEPGDLLGLSKAITQVLLNWDEYHEQAIEVARKNFGWDKAIEQIYSLYQTLLDPEPAHSVSVVIPLHNYAQWVGQAIHSARMQTKKPLEIIVVDDASTDRPVIPDDVRYIRLQKNGGVANARNIGIAQAKGDIILCLDADDVLAKDYIKRAIPQFANPRTGIVFGPLALTDENGTLLGKRWFDQPPKLKEQFIGHNQVPTCCVFRKDAWERAGGYRSYESPAEDAGLWTRIIAQGWEVAYLPDRVTMFYRMHNGSLSRTYKFPDWVGGRAWKNRSSGVGNPVQIYDCPRISFILEYRISQEREFIQTVDSIEGLKAIDWEICATGAPTQLVKTGFPFIRWNEHSLTETEVYLEVGEKVTEERWQEIKERTEFPCLKLP